MSIKFVDTTLRDGSHAIAHQFRVDQVRTIAGALDRAGVWAVAVGHGDGLGADSIQYGRPLCTDTELLTAASEVVERARIAVAILPGIGTRTDLEAARDAGASVARISTVCTEADIGLQHLRLARGLGMTAHSHLNTAHLLDAEGFVEQAKRVVEAGSQAIFIVDSAGTFLPDDVRNRISAMRAALPDDVELGIHEHNNLSLAVANSAAAIEEGATLVDTSLAGLGAGAGNCQTEALAAVLERMGVETGLDLWALQDVADNVVRDQVMTRPLVVDRFTGTMGLAAVPASYLLHAIRGGERFGLDPRDIIVELGKRKVVVGQEDVIIEIAAEMANSVDDWTVITVVLDDDPTGTQAASNISVVLDWSDPDVWATVDERDRGVHVLTNSRAHDGDGAGLLVASAAAAARTEFPTCRLLLRGDSTLRAHLWEEYEAVRSVIAPGRQDVPLLLVPALPAAGRITIDGVHLLERDGQRIPVGRTEYAQDGQLAYTNSDLSLWAEERSQGRLAADDAVRVPLDRLHQPDGATAVTQAIATAAQLGRPAAVIPDAETDADLRTIAEGQRAAEQAGTPIVVRCAPAFAAIVTGSTANGPVGPPSGDNGILLVCGSFVATSTKQIEQLGEAHPGAIVSASVARLAAPDWELEVERIAELARSRIDSEGLAVVVTDRQHNPALVDPESQRQIATALAQVARRVNAGLTIAKGGITSAVTAREGLGARSARVVGPILPGVALWRLDVGKDYVVVPGNVGGPGLLADLVSLIRRSARTSQERHADVIQ